MMEGGPGLREDGSDNFQVLLACFASCHQMCDQQAIVLLALAASCRRALRAIMMVVWTGCRDACACCMTLADGHSNAERVRLR